MEKDNVLREFGRNLKAERNRAGLSQEKLAELITVDEFIRRNRPRINDVRADKQQFEKDSSYREPYLSSENKFDFVSEQEKKPLMEHNDEQLRNMADEVSHGDMGEYKRGNLHKIDISSMCGEDNMQFIENTGDKKKSAAAEKETEAKKERRKIKASTRDIPEFVYISDVKGGVK